MQNLGRVEVWGVREVVVEPGQQQASSEVYRQRMQENHLGGEVDASFGSFIPKQTGWGPRGWCPTVLKTWPD